MPFAAKTAVPSTATISLRHPTLQRAVESRITLFTALVGYLPTDSLAAALAEQGRPTAWLRLDSSDRDPATFLTSLIAAAQRLCSDVGTATLEQMQQQPGPVTSWPPLFTQLGRELTARLPESSALVIEHLDYLNNTQPTLELLVTHLLPKLPDNFTLIFTTQQHLSQHALPDDTIHRGVNDLRLDDQTTHAIANQTSARLPSASIHRMVALTEGRAVALSGIIAASDRLGANLIQHAIDRATSMDDLLNAIARAWLATADADTVQMLALALRIGYSHPAMTQAVLSEKASGLGPWWEPLEEDWMRMRRVWQPALRRALRRGATASSKALHRAADYLLSQGATEQAVPLYFELGDLAGAAQAINGAIGTLMNMGQWETLGHWLSQLPMPTLHAWPWLVYALGEIAIAQGQANLARNAFGTATVLFTARHDADGACQSLLAESTLAVWHGDRASAQTRALAAHAMAEGAGLAWQQAWAAWQLGCLAAADEKLDDALAYFDKAAAAADAASDPFMVELLRQVEALALQQRDLGRQREFHRQAYFTTERAEQEAGQRLHLLLSTPLDRLDVLLAAHGWSRTPLMLKLSEPQSPAELIESPHSHTSLWSKLLGAIGLRRRAITAAGVDTLAENPPSRDVPPTLPANLGSSSWQTLLIPNATFMPVGLAETDQIGLSKSSVETSMGPRLTAHLLGAFRITVNDRSVENWPSGRGRAVFKYLLTHRDVPTPRDVLMEVFWPNANPEAARNNLNVSLHGLRQALRAVTDIPVVTFQEDAYHLNPDLYVWLDVDEFERHVQAGRKLEVAGQLAAAAADYEVATGLYQGDFLADDPYEEWPVLTRERLRVAYLDILDRLSHIYFSQGQYAACGTLCQLILARDNCREDAHCRLMRCYSRQNQNHLALRQYQTCVEALHAELQVEPAPTTTQLYERIRRREHV